LPSHTIWPGELDRERRGDARGPGIGSDRREADHEEWQRDQEARHRPRGADVEEVARRTVGPSSLMNAPIVPMIEK
jgi:hypothetical protein